MERWTITQLARLHEQPCHALEMPPVAAPAPSADPWERAIARARAEASDLIESGDLSHDEITTGWIETWAADLYAAERAIP